MFIGITLGLGLFLWVLFRWGRYSGIKSTTRLHLLKNSRNTKTTAVSTMSREAREARPEEFGSKDLNILFMYNGHSFDAYEILGIPAGASLEMVEDSYLQMKASLSEESREFVETAYQVLRQELTQRRRSAQGS